MRYGLKSRVMGVWEQEEGRIWGMRCAGAGDGRPGCQFKNNHEERLIVEKQRLERGEWAFQTSVEGGDPDRRTAVLPSFKEQQGSHCLSCRELRISDFCPKMLSWLPMSLKNPRSSLDGPRDLTLVSSLISSPTGTFKFMKILNYTGTKLSAKKVILIFLNASITFFGLQVNNEHHSVRALVTGYPEDRTERKW